MTSTPIRAASPTCPSSLRRPCSARCSSFAILFIEVKKNPDAATLRGKILKFLAAVKKAPPVPKA